MARTIETTGKTIEDALRAALSELGVAESDAEYEVLEEPRKGILGIIGTRAAKIKVTVKDKPAPVEPKVEEPVEPPPPIVEEKLEEVAAVEEAPAIETEAVETTVEEAEEPFDPAPTIERAKAFLADVLEKMHLKVTIEEQMLEEGCMLNISGNNLGILIGKHGQTLDALQYIVNLAANNRQERRVRFMLDVEGYREKRAESLTSLAKSLADRAIKMRKEVRLEPMSRYERKIIHLTLQENPRVSTHSAGTEPYRYVIITPKKGEK